MSKRVWHKGPPPHVGWWNASIDRLNDSWRWWDGGCWSFCCSKDDSLFSVKRFSVSKTDVNQSKIEWTDYWPENARVQRVDPSGK